LSRTKTIISIENEKIVDAAVFQQLILHNIEPDLQIQLHYINYEYVYATGEFLWKVKVNKSKVRKSSRLFN